MGKIIGETPACVNAGKSLKAITTRVSLGQKPGIGIPHRERFR